MKLSLFVRFYLGTFLVFVLGIGGLIVIFEFYFADEDQQRFVVDAQRFAEPYLEEFENGDDISVEKEYSRIYGTYFGIETVDDKLHSGLLQSYELLRNINGIELYEQDDNLYMAVFPNSVKNRYLLVFEFDPDDSDSQDYEQAASDLFLISVLLIVSLGIALVVFWVSRTVERPVRQLVKIANAYGDADFSKRADDNALKPIGTLAGSLNHMADRLRSLLDDQRVINHAIAHELRTPLTRMRLALEMIDTDGLDKQSAALIGNIDRYIVEMTALTSSVLTFGKVSGPDTSGQHAPINADDFVCLRIDQLRSGGGVQLETQLTTEALIRIPPMHWQLVVDNLVKNAQSYARSQVWLCSQIDVASYRLFVDDDGPGISPADRDSVFTPFARLDASRDVHSGGFGLGLAIVHSIIKRYRGNVWVEESPVGGARFVVEIPCEKSLE